MISEFWLRPITLAWALHYGVLAYGGGVGSTIGRDDSADQGRQFGKWITTRRKEVHSRRRPSEQTGCSYGFWVGLTRAMRQLSCPSITLHVTTSPTFRFSFIKSSFGLAKIHSYFFDHYFTHYCIFKIIHVS